MPECKYFELKDKDNHFGKIPFCNIKLCHCVFNDDERYLCPRFDAKKPNPVNDNGLKNNVPQAMLEWHRCEHGIDKLIKKQEECCKAKEAGYTEEEIRQLIGNIAIPSWYLINKL